MAPPTAPPSAPPSAPPTWAAGPPPEYLEAGGGHPLPPQPPTGSAGGGGGRKKLILGAVAVLGAGAVAAGAFAAVSFFGTGAQPAEALPANTLGYVSIDLDPSGGQKIEAVRTLRKFPAFKDEIGLDTDDDIRERIFEEIQKSDECEGLDYSEDIEPWLGDRVAFAAVDLGGEEDGEPKPPTPVLVVQVKDADKADAGLQKLRDCSSDEEAEGLDESDEVPDEVGGWSIDGDWAVISESQEVAEEIAAQAAESSLADDDDYQRWTGETGDAGIITAYAAPEAGQVLAESLGGFDLPMGDEDCALSEPIDPLSPEPSYEYECSGGGLDGMMPDEFMSMLEDFEGAALTVRFDDGSLEVETATGTELLGLPTLTGSDQGGTAIATLPEDTAAAFGLGFEEGWFDELLDYASSFSGEGMDIDELIAEAEAETGLSLPEDAETLAGESLTVAVGSDFDPDVVFNSSDGSDIPVAVKIKGDPEAIESVLAKLNPSMDVTFGSDSEGDYVVVGPNADYRAELLDDGGLGDTDVYQDVVREADRSGAILFVNFDAGDGWLANLAGDDQEIKENLEPLAGLGLSAWEDDGVGHSVLRITTD
jgi:hypothetical protein